MRSPDTACGMRGNKITSNITGRLTIKGSAEKKEPSPGRAWRISLRGENHRSQGIVFHGGESKEQTNITERSSTIESEKCPCDSVISSQEDEFGSKISISAEF